MTAVLCLLFALSGAAALLFETLWFRQAGLLLGNTVWAASLVTAGFMAGLALGNLAAIRLATRLRRPLRAYAALEVLIALTGLGLVLALPWLSRHGAGVLAALPPGLVLNAVRLGSAFVLLVLPSSAMGATLPLLARTLGARDPNFGRVLGRLYGWNTLGAVAGALAGEAILIGRFGVSGTAMVAAGLDVVAAAGAFLLDLRQPALTPSAPLLPPTVRRAGRAPAAAFLAGFLLLGLEVIWFRFLQLFMTATTATFAIMLAVVLVGIAGGSLLAAVWLARRPDHHRAAPLVALAASVATVVSYAAFPRALAPHGSDLINDFHGVVAECLWLMLPVCVLSGILFTLLGKAVQAGGLEDARAAGILTLANTVGAMLGALVGGFLLLPYLGVEWSLFLVAAGYLGVAALAPSAAERGGERRVRALAWAVAILICALFPFGLMQRAYVGLVAQRWSQDGSRLVSAKEGLTETVLLFRRDSLQRPLWWRLVTNGIGMSATHWVAHRYMGLFVWLPVALHPEPRSALVISYGLGTTARALTDTRELTSIDVVDISADILRLSAGVWPEERANPLRDPRVRVHVEDGRFFLLTTRQRFDLITGEPPPPKAAGITSLYSREYFGLVRERLNEGGLATYWLPVTLFEAREAFSVVRGFCEVFSDCSLWTGYGSEWILMGGRNARGPVSEERFARQWHDPVVAGRLKEAGVESPDQLGATFLGDGESLARLIAASPPLVDDHPQRLDPRVLTPPPSPVYFELMRTGPARDRFRTSAVVHRLWPAGWRESSLAAFEPQALVNRFAWPEGGAPVGLAELEQVLTHSSYETVALWYLDTSAEEEQIAASLAASGVQAPEVWELQGLAALARRDYRTAESKLSEAEPHALHGALIRQWRILAAGLTGDRERARRLLAEAGPLTRSPLVTPASWAWITQRFGTSSPQP